LINKKKKTTEGVQERTKRVGIMFVDVASPISPTLHFILILKQNMKGNVQKELVR
jgi:hypothetical protein